MAFKCPITYHTPCDVFRSITALLSQFPFARTRIRLYYDYSVHWLCYVLYSLFFLIQLTFLSLCGHTHPHRKCCLNFVDYQQPFLFSYRKFCWAWASKRITSSKYTRLLLNPVKWVLNCFIDLLPNPVPVTWWSPTLKWRRTDRCKWRIQNCQPEGVTNFQDAVPQKNTATDKQG